MLTCSAELAFFFFKGKPTVILGSEWQIAEVCCFFFGGGGDGGRGYKLRRVLAQAA